jgi:excisionase family DNA binding protein
MTQFINTAQAVKPALVYQEFLTVKELAEYLRISKSKIWKLSASRQLPGYRPNNGILLFKKTEVDAWLNTFRLRTISELISPSN